MTPETSPPNVNPPKKWRIVRRELRYGFLASLLGAMGLIVVARVRSSTWKDRVEVSVVEDRVILFKSKEGELTVGLFKTEGRAYQPSLESEFPTFGPCRLYSRPMYLSYVSSADGYTSLEERIERRKLPMGVDTISQIKFSVVQHAPLNISFGSYSLWRGNTYSGFGIALPHWMLLFLLGMIFTLIALGRRFTLRAFLIWVTIVCIFLAIAVRTREIPKVGLLLRNGPCDFVQGNDV